MTLGPDVYRQSFGYREEPEFPPRFNIAPTQPVAVLRGEAGPNGGTRRFQLVRWGFVPSFIKVFSAFKPAFNAWSEELVDKPSFRNAFRRRRCLFLADGFYVWHRTTDTSQPYLLRRFDGTPFGMAGLTETWLGADGSEIDTACIITAPAVPEWLPILPRAPVVIAAENIDTWLDPDERRSSAAAGLMLPPTDGFEAVPIGPGVNKAANDGAWVQEPVGPAIRFAPARPPSPRQSPQGELF